MDHQQSGMFSYISAERRVPKDQPLRDIRVMADAALKESSWRFDAVYASSGRPIAPEKLLRALLLQVLYTVRIERLLMKQLDYNFLFRWFAASERGRTRLPRSGACEEAADGDNRRATPTGPVVGNRRSLIYGLSTPVEC
jgi:hypothetical protein